MLVAALSSARAIRIDDVKEVETWRMKTIQKLHVAQAPLHAKQDKATEVEIKTYAAAIVETVALQRWVAGEKRCSIILKNTGNHSNDPLNQRNYSKLIWAIHDAEIKTSPPFTRKDIGVAIKMMNDLRELMMLPVMVNAYSSMPDRQ